MASKLTIDYSLRIDRELSLLGEFSDDVKTEFIREALRQFIRLYEPDDISATIAVTVDVLEYSIPDAIEKIASFRDENNKEVYFTLDTYRRKITLATPPSGSVNYTVYGTPNSISDNTDTILAGLDEDYESCLWQLIRYCAHQENESDRQDLEFQKARRMIVELRQYRNRNKATYKQAINFIDRTGRKFDDPNNVDGITETNSGYEGLNL